MRRPNLLDSSFSDIRAIYRLLWSNGSQTVWKICTQRFSYECETIHLKFLFGVRF